MLEYAENNPTTIHNNTEISVAVRLLLNSATKAGVEG